MPFVSPETNYGNIDINYNISNNFKIKKNAWEKITIWLQKSIWRKFSKRLITSKPYIEFQKKKFFIITYTFMDL